MTFFESQLPSISAIEALKRTGNTGKAMEYSHLRQTCSTATIRAIMPSDEGLRTNNDDSQLGRRRTLPNDMQVGLQLVQVMGRKARLQEGDPFAGQYVDNWRQVSDNCSIVTDMVRRELEHAHRLGLDVQREEAIGLLFDLATQIWSVAGDYSSSTQSIRR